MTGVATGPATLDTGPLASLADTLSNSWLRMCVELWRWCAEDEGDAAIGPIEDAAAGAAPMAPNDGDEAALPAVLNMSDGEDSSSKDFDAGETAMAAAIGVASGVARGSACCGIGAR